MATQIAETMTVRDLVVRHPGLREVLEKLGVDYCCGGRHTLKESAEEKGLNLATVLAGLESALAAQAKQKDAVTDWSKASLTELANYIEAHHHAFMKQQLPRLAGLLAKVVVAHGARHGEVLRALGRVFAELKQELDEHLLKEERVLFPAIRKLEPGSAQGLRGAAWLRGPIEQMEHEHEHAGQALAQMRTLTSNYQLPGDACPTFAALYEGLVAVEADLHEHIHLENNILFPRVLGEAQAT